MSMNHYSLTIDHSPLPTIINYQQFLTSINHYSEHRLTPYRTAGFWRLLSDFVHYAWAKPRSHYLPGGKVTLNEQFAIENGHLMVIEWDLMVIHRDSTNKNGDVNGNIPSGNGEQFAMENGH